MSDHQEAKRTVLVAQTPARVRSSTKESLPRSNVRYVYLLSPANAKGRRAEMLFNPKSTFELASRLRTTGISLGEAFSFMSALYFRGKLTYTATFSRSTDGVPSTWIITPSRGLLAPERVVTLSELVEISAERIATSNPKYRDPLEHDLRRLARTLGAHDQVVLLGSIATRKYIPLLVEIFGECPLVPRAFIGLGNMSRGALLLRCVRERRLLEYIPISEAVARRWLTETGLPTARKSS